MGGGELNLPTFFEYMFNHRLLVEVVNEEVFHGFE